MPPRRDCTGRLPENSRILGTDPSESSPWTPGPLGHNDWADPNKIKIYAQAGGGSLSLGINQAPSGIPSLFQGKIDFLILELGPDQKDSIAFKKAMETHKLGRDLTPKLVGLKRPTQKQDVTYLSALEESDFVTPQFRQWVRQFAACKPVFLYISGHHADSKPIFFNNNNCGLLIAKDKIKVGKYVSIAFMDIFTESGRQTIEVSSSGLSENLLVIIGDACSLISSGVISGGASQLQAALANKHGKPIVLGFGGKSPPSGTDQLHSSFVSLLAKRLKQGPMTGQNAIDCWITAGQHWSNQKYKQNLGLLGTDGKYRSHDGKVLDQH